MVTEQFAQLGSTAKEPKLITAFVAVTVTDCVLAEATDPHVTRQAPMTNANLPITPDLYKKVAIYGNPLRS
jgi:hypothetical protein